MSERLGDKIIADLRAGRLPQMVDWFDPALLVRIGIRDIISGTIGQYADQRLMQAASDKVSSEGDLAHRYDYSDVNASDPDRRILRDADGAVWIDYIADLGDGFEATYAMATLMAPETLTVRSAEQGAMTLPAGQILIMGGDQAYPQATAEEYEKRLINPYSWSFTTKDPQRKLFAIPGNHDWYDGLGAFTALFTAARSRISDGLGRQIGGWRSMQHRSYFAIKLPHDWWIWGPDIQLGGTLDDPQRDYFDIVADYTKPGDKIVLCLAEPSWLHQNYDNLHEINLMARKRGAKVCAMLAGDWHHYSRYANEELGIPLITCGGGGAFAHATHQLKNTINFDWAIGSEDGAEKPAHAPPPEPHASAPQVVVHVSPEGSGHFPKSASAAAAPAAASHAAATLDDDARYRKFRAKFAPRKKTPLRMRSVRRKTFACEAKAIYPSKMKSRLISLKNLLLPFHNRSFALFVGVVYFLYAWVFQASAPELAKPEAVSSLEALPAAISTSFWAAIAPERVIGAATNNPAFFFMLLGLWGGLIYYVDLGKGFFNSAGKVLIGTVHFLAHLNTLLFINLIAVVPGFIISLIPAFMVNAFGSHSNMLVQISFLLSYSLVSIFLGGLLGAAIMGLYWTVTAAVFNMHCGDAFGALGIKDYKNFLRMKFEPEKLTIYPIAIDKVPGPKEWRAAGPGEGGTNGAEIVPMKPLEPRLIEEPIVIRASAVSTHLQRIE